MKKQLFTAQMAGANQLWLFTPFGDKISYLLSVGGLFTPRGSLPSPEYVSSGPNYRTRDTKHHTKSDRNEGRSLSFA